MATRTLAAAVAATLLVTGCVSPYADVLKTELAACQANDATACSNATTLQAQDQTWHAQQAEQSANVAAAILGSLAIGAAAYAASRPVYVAPVYTPPINCYSNRIGNFVNTSCY